MVTLGMRPGTILNFGSYKNLPEGDDRKKIDLILIDDVCMMLDLKHELIDDQNGYTAIAISKDPTVAKEIIANFDKPVEPNQTLEKERERKKGMLLGIPETAIDGWVNGEMMDYKQLPEEVKNSLELKAFDDFRFSKNNWHEEFELVKERAYKIEKLAPKIFNAVLSMSMKLSAAGGII